jgi:hypothetical protein
MRDLRLKARSWKILAVLAGLCLLEVLLPQMLSAEIYSYCDAEGRLVVYILDEQGRMTMFMRTVNPSSQCT